MKKKIVSPIRKVVKKSKVATPPQPVQEESVEEVIEVQEVVEEKFKDFREYLNVFEFDCILPGSQEHIKFKPLTVGALKRVLAHEGDTGNAEVITSMFDDIFDVCVLNKGFDPKGMLIFDRYALILEIRKKTKGEKSEFETKCPKCKGQSVQSIDYEDIKQLPVPEDIDYIVRLTDELSVSMQYITRADELLVFDIARKNNKGMTQNQKEAEVSLFLEALSVDKIITPQGPQDDVTVFDKKYLLEQLPQPLYEKIGEWHEKYKFGPQLEINIKCPHCEYEMEENVSELSFF